MGNQNWLIRFIRFVTGLRSSATAWPTQLTPIFGYCSLFNVLLPNWPDPFSNPNSDRLNIHFVILHKIFFANLFEFQS